MCTEKPSIFPTRMKRLNARCGVSNAVRINDTLT